jgi:hypothetical protein
VPYLPLFASSLLILFCLFVLWFAVLLEFGYKRNTKNWVYTLVFGFLLFLQTISIIMSLIYAISNNSLVISAAPLACFNIILIEYKFQDHLGYFVRTVPKFLVLLFCLTAMIILYTSFAYYFFEAGTTEFTEWFPDFGTGLWNMFMIFDASDWPSPAIPAIHQNRLYCIYFYLFIIFFNWGLLNLFLGFVYLFVKIEQSNINSRHLIIKQLYLLTAFQIMDVERKGSLTYHQVDLLIAEIYRNYVETMNPPTLEERYELLLELDLEGNGKISFKNFEQIEEKCFSDSLKALRAKKIRFHRFLSTANAAPERGTIVPESYYRSHDMFSESSTNSNARLLSHLTKESYLVDNPVLLTNVVASQQHQQVNNNQNNINNHNHNNQVEQSTENVSGKNENHIGEISYRQSRIASAASTYGKIENQQLVDRLRSIEIMNKLTETDPLSRNAKSTTRFQFRRWFGTKLSTLAMHIDTIYYDIIFDTILLLLAILAFALPQEASWNTFLVFLALSIVESVTKLIVKGRYRYLKSTRNFFDGVITITLFGVTLGMVLNHQTYTFTNNFGLQSLVLVRILLYPRNVIVLKSFVSFRRQHKKAFKYAFKSAGHVAFLSLVMFAMLYGMAALGVQIFGGTIIKTGATGTEISASLYGQSGYWPLNFNDMPSAIVTMFTLLHVNNMHVTTSGFVASTSQWAELFFAIWYSIGVLLLLNILIAVFVNQFAGYLEVLARDRQQKTVQSQMLNEDSLQQGSKLLLKEDSLSAPGTYSLPVAPPAPLATSPKRSHNNLHKDDTDLEKAKQERMMKSGQLVPPAPNTESPRRKSATQKQQQRRPSTAQVERIHSMRGGFEDSIFADNSYRQSLLKMMKKETSNFLRPSYGSTSFSRSGKLTASSTHLRNKSISDQDGQQLSRATSETDWRNSSSSLQSRPDLTRGFSQPIQPIQQYQQQQQRQQQQQFQHSQSFSHSSQFPMNINPIFVTRDHQQHRLGDVITTDQRNRMDLDAVDMEDDTPIGEGEDDDIVVKLELKLQNTQDGTINDAPRESITQAIKTIEKHVTAAQSKLSPKIAEQQQQQQLQAKNLKERTSLTSKKPPTSTPSVHLVGEEAASTTRRSLLQEMELAVPRESFHNKEINNNSNNNNNNSNRDSEKEALPRVTGISMYGSISEHEMNKTEVSRPTEAVEELPTDTDTTLGSFRYLLRSIFYCFSTPVDDFPLSRYEKAAVLIQFARDGEEQHILNTRFSFNCYKLRHKHSRLFQFTAALLILLRFFERPMWTFITSPDWSNNHIYPRFGIPLISAELMCAIKFPIFVLLFTGLLLELGYKEYSVRQFLYNLYKTFEYHLLNIWRGNYFIDFWNFLLNSQLITSKTDTNNNSSRRSNVESRGASFQSSSYKDGERRDSTKDVRNTFDDSDSCSDFEILSFSRIFRMFLSLHCLSLLLMLLFVVFTNFTIYKQLVTITSAGSVLYFLWFNRRTLQKLKIVLQIIPKFLVVVFILAVFILIVAGFGPMIFQLENHRDDDYSSTNDDDSTIYFNSFSQSIWSVFVAITSSSWPNQVMPAYHSQREIAIYFMTFITIGSFGLLNLIIVIVFIEFQKSLQSSFDRHKITKEILLIKAFEILDQEKKKGYLEYDEISVLCDEIYQNYSNFTKIGFTKSIVRQLLIEILDIDGDEKISLADFMYFLDVMRIKLTFYTKYNLMDYYRQYLQRQQLIKQHKQQQQQMTGPHSFHSSHKSSSTAGNTQNTTRGTTATTTFTPSLPRLSLSTQLLHCVFSVVPLSFLIFIERHYVSNRLLDLTTDSVGLFFFILNITVNGIHNLYNPNRLSVLFMLISVGFYLHEMLLKLFYRGLQDYFRSYRNRMDFLTTMLLFAAIVIDSSIQLLYQNDFFTFIMKIAYLLRIFMYPRNIRLLFLNNRDVRKIAKLFRRIFTKLYTLAMVFFCISFCYANIGMFLYGGKIDKHSTNGHFLNSQFVLNDFWPINFNDFMSSMSTLFICLHVSDFDVVTTGFTSSTTPYSRIYFGLWYVIGVMFMLNVLKSFFLGEFLALFINPMENLPSFNLKNSKNSSKGPQKSTDSNNTNPQANADGTQPPPQTSPNAPTSQIKDNYWTSKQKIMNESLRSRLIQRLNNSLLSSKIHLDEKNRNLNNYDENNFLDDDAPENDWDDDVHKNRKRKNSVKPTNNQQQDNYQQETKEDRHQSTSNHHQNNLAAAVVRDSDTNSNMNNNNVSRQISSASVLSKHNLKAANLAFFDPVVIPADDNNNNNNNNNIITPLNSGPNSPKGNRNNNNHKTIVTATIDASTSGSRDNLDTVIDDHYYMNNITTTAIPRSPQKETTNNNNNNNNNNNEYENLSSPHSPLSPMRGDGGPEVESSQFREVDVFEGNDVPVTNPMTNNNNNNNDLLLGAELGATTTTIISNPQLPVDPNNPMVLDANTIVVSHLQTKVCLFLFLSISIDYLLIVFFFSFFQGLDAQGEELIRNRLKKLSLNPKTPK